MQKFLSVVSLFSLSFSAFGASWYYQCQGYRVGFQRVHGGYEVEYSWRYIGRNLSQTRSQGYCENWRYRSLGYYCSYAVDLNGDEMRCNQWTNVGNVVRTER